MRTSILILAVAGLQVVLCAQTVVTKSDSPGARNTSVVYYDDRFLFLGRHYGDHRDFGGNTKPGFFVHSKAHDRWLQILQVSTKDAKFGKTLTGVGSRGGWDFTAYTNKSWIDLSLTEDSIGFPDKIELDATGDRYKMSFFTSWKIESAASVLYVSRKDLSDRFDKITKP